MSEHTGISYLDATWGITTGCTPVGAGCDHCWARVMATRKAANPIIKERADYAAVLTNGHWNGQVRLLENRLDWPLKWKKPKVIGVAFESDLFHEAVSDEFIDRVVNVMWATPRHTYLALTKRPERAGHYFATRWQRIHYSGRYSEAVLPDNLWLGISVWDQASADCNIPLLLKTPAAHRWISAEPLLGGVDFVQAVNSAHYWTNVTRIPNGIDLLIIGCESGPGARPMQEDWARSVVAQCEAAGVIPYLKQMTVGGKVVALPELDSKRYDKLPWRQGGRV